jgi:hypothetical protein
MHRAKRRLAVIGVCVGLVSVAIVLNASGVQAEKGANWMVNGTNITTLLPEVQIKEVVMNDMNLVGTSQGGTKLEILCTTAKFSNTKLEAEGRVSSGSTTKFSGCITRLNGTLSKPCEPHTGAENGVIVSKPLKGLLVLSEGEAMIEFTPSTGTIFVTITLGEECSIEGGLPVAGNSLVKDTSKAFTTELANHIVEQAAASKLTLCGNPATISGKASLELVGVHSGLKWSGLPA